MNGSGCPVDSDGDGVADYLDLEPRSLVLPVDAFGVAMPNTESRSPLPSIIRLDFKQIVAEPTTGNRPHLPVGQALQLDKIPNENRTLDADQ